MRRAVLLGLAVLVCTAWGHDPASHEAPSDPMPQFSGDRLVRPEGYREWIYLSSGLGMNYNPAPGMAELFTNVFVPQWAYRQFGASGKWPDKTWFVLEERNQQTKGSINKTGHFQTDLMGLAVEVKDEKRFPDTWAYFGFGGEDKTAPANPKAACWECHENNAAVEHSFVQFYPTLRPIAQKFGTYRDHGEAATASH
jgi:Cytochrome P460